MPLIGRPMLSTTLAIRSGGMMVRIFCSISSARRGGFLKPGSGRRPQMQSDRAGVDRREKILSEIGGEPHGQHGDTKKAARKVEAVSQRHLQQADIALAQPFEMMFEAALKAPEQADPRSLAGFCVRRMMVLVAQQKMRHRRHQRVGEQVGRDHREHHRHRERPEQIAGDSAEREQRHESDADTEQRDRRRRHDFVRAARDGVRMSSPNSSICRFMFSIVTVASSTRMPIGHYRTPQIAFTHGFFYSP